MTNTPVAVPPRRSERRREELLDAAADVFRQKGVAASTVAEITERAGVGKGTFYLYFETKDHAVAALDERMHADMQALVAESLPRLDEESLLDVFGDVIAQVIDHWIEQRDLFTVICRWGQPADFIDHMESLDEVVVGLCTEGALIGIERGDIVQVGDPEITSRFLLHGFKGITIHALLQEGPIDRDQLVDNAQAIARTLLEPDPAE